MNAFEIDENNFWQFSTIQMTFKRSQTIDWNVALELGIIRLKQLLHFWKDSIDKLCGSEVESYQHKQRKIPE